MPRTQRPVPDPRLVGWLREAGRPVSGEELASRLGCSRAAVWKHIAALRAQGFAIGAHHARGYSLDGTPDRLDAMTLAPLLRGRWREIDWHERIDSTQRRARELGRAGADEGAVVVAEAQTAGRGRLGRSWHSPAGLNLYCSILLRPSVALADVPQIALVAGLAVAEAVEVTTGLGPRLKWPNDVLLEGRKTAGILTELEAEEERVQLVIAGIGVNLNVEAFPEELADKATSLRLAVGHPVDRGAFLAGLLAAFEARYERFLASGFAPMRAEWESYAALTGRTVRVAAPQGEVAGRVLGLDDDGALRLDRGAGDVVRVVAGEVSVVDGYGG